MTCTDKECCYHGQPKASSCECVNDKPQKRAGGPAFPQKLSFCDGGGIEYFGLSVRDYFAAKAMLYVGEMAPNVDAETIEQAFATLAKLSFKMADAMMKAREE